MRRVLMTTALVLIACEPAPKMARGYPKASFQSAFFVYMEQY
jgi:hypothetical protein